MGAGKSSVGRALAKELGCEFIDLDSLLESRVGKTIAEIFASSGEQSFRKLESQVLGDVLKAQAPRSVIALGGGAYVQHSNRELISRSPGLVVYLEVSLEEAVRRIQSFGRQRPLASDLEHLEKLFHERRSAYEQAHFRTDTTNKSVESVAKELAAWIRKQERE